MNWLQWTAVLFLALPLTSHAEKVELLMPNKLVARAEFHQGAVDKPAVLLMHGFLQTFEFPTIFRLAETLHSAGYTVLAPSLTLNIPSRRQSLACEAIHTHTVDGDSREIDTWLKWLDKKQPGNVVLVGHSTGSMQLLAYLGGRSHPNVKKLIAISIIEAQSTLSGKERSRLTADLRARVARGDTLPMIQPISFCKKLNALPATLLSYQEWTPERILRRVDHLSQPVTFVIGSQDERLGKRWVAKLKQTRAKVRIIEGANHFMDGEHEFDLHEHVQEELREL